MADGDDDEDDIDEPDGDDADDAAATEPESCYFEMLDPVSGVVYYIFSETGEASWYPPTWVDVYDDNTGYYYYSNTKVGCHHMCLGFPITDHAAGLQ